MPSDRTYRAFLNTPAGAGLHVREDAFYAQKIGLVVGDLEAHDIKKICLAN